jgi:hypothetical protein
MSGHNVRLSMPAERDLAMPASAGLLVATTGIALQLNRVRAAIDAVEASATETDSAVAMANWTVAASAAARLKALAAHLNQVIGAMAPKQGGVA